MEIYFGLALDDLAYPLPQTDSGGILHLGPQGLLNVLESCLGLTGHPADNDYLRIEQYRQGLRLYLENHPGTFYQASFEADQFAAAAELLSRRDELLLAGWDFQTGPGIPDRLRCLAEVEELLRSRPELQLAAGYADRFIEALRQLDKRRHPIACIRLNEPLDLLPHHFRRLFLKLESAGVTLETLQPSPPEENQSDLAQFQNLLIKGQESGKKVPLKGDGSVLIIRGKRETDLATWLARLFRRNPDYRPACLLPDKNRAIDNALIQEGLPAMGIASASLARPTLQVLKLITAFLWNPIDPFKVMEFVSLAIKPLEEQLANRIAEQIAKTPGINGEGWYYTINRYFDEIAERAKFDPHIKIDEIRRQYNFWFERRRYDISQTAPKEDIIELFSYLQHWAGRIFDETGGKNHSLQVLREQAKRIVELLQALPENQLSNLELERIVRTIYEPAPVQFSEQELGCLQYFHHPGAIIGHTGSLLWWNFVNMEQDHFFSRWYQEERRYMDQKGFSLEGPKTENDRLIWYRKRPVLYCRQRLVLVMPSIVDGTEVHPHPLYGDLEAAFSNLEIIVLDIETGSGKDAVEKIFDLPRKVNVPSRLLGKPRPFLYLPSGRRLDEREEETFSSLEALFYYPYQWVFRHKIKLAKSSILSVVKDVTLMGNLAHRFFERLLKEDISKMDKTAVESWIEQEARSLLSREGAVLLMYGREPDRSNFLHRIKYAAWSLIDLIQRNGWRVVETEKPLEGKFLGIPLNGRADLILEKDGQLAVIDLKWRGAARRERAIRNEEDIQLVFYSRLSANDHTWAHTAYFIMESGRMVARNHLAFRDIIAVSPDADHIEVNQRIFERMEATFRWRLDQIKQGRIEIRCQQTYSELDETYASELIDLLEMKKEDAPFDDYRTLINLVE